MNGLNVAFMCLSQYASSLGAGVHIVYAGLTSQASLSSEIACTYLGEKVIRCIWDRDSGPVILNDCQRQRGLLINDGQLLPLPAKLTRCFTKVLKWLFVSCAEEMQLIRDFKPHNANINYCSTAKRSIQESSFFNGHRWSRVNGNKAFIEPKNTFLCHSDFVFFSLLSSFQKVNLGQDEKLFYPRNCFLVGMQLCYISLLCLCCDKKSLLSNI